jgi:phosphatidylserine/phosphatidylglycerophosphate/cardiolipin synthase-like enzyme
MRNISKQTDGYTIYAVSGTNTVSFAIDFRKADTKGLLGFAVERINMNTGDRRYMAGYKVFKSIIPNPDSDTIVNTYSHPVQSFVWDDFACYDNTRYEYLFYPLKGTPKKIDRTSDPVTIRIKTEKLFTDGEHDIFFNRGVASSQAYRRKFFNLIPDEISSPYMKKAALDWLSRQLDDALIKFISSTSEGETLLGCFYEFHYKPIVMAFKEAIKKKVIVKIIIDAKENEHIDKKGKFYESYPRLINLQTLSKVGIPSSKSSGYIIKRESRKNDIQHNKFLVKLDSKGKPIEIWTGSTNISIGGIHGQTNVGHLIRNEEVALKYYNYWKLLKTDPGGSDSDDRKTVIKKNKILRDKVEAIQKSIVFKDWSSIPHGITAVFSPRNGISMLETYFKMFDNAKNMACVTLAFGINRLFKDYLKDNTNASHISFLLLEKEDKPNSKSKEPYLFIGSKENVYKSWGAYIEDDLCQWAKEKSTSGLGLNTHVLYIHSKFMLIDPLSNDPKVVTGSANFSEASTTQNDENMLIIRGNKRVADIYYTEFNRLFNHYYFRSVYNSLKKRKRTGSASLFLDTTDKWIKKYRQGTFRYKRIMMFTRMHT